MSSARDEPSESPQHGKRMGDDNDAEDAGPSEKLPPGEEAKLRGECDDRKSEANALFSSARYEDAINVYEDAVALCPHYLDYELAVLKSNIAACHLKLEQWKEAVGSATAALDGLDRFEKNDSKPGDAPEDGEGEASTSVPEEADEEIVSPGAQKRASCAAQESPQQHAGHRGSWEDVLRIKAKALMRRARARSELGGWSNLAGAEEDYKLVSTLPGLGVADKRVINAQLRELPRRTTQAREKEMGEMWGKLKDLGNGILKPFGLRTDNFQMVKDEKTGGYSMNYQGGNN